MTRAEASAQLFRQYIGKTQADFYDGAHRYTQGFIDKDKLEFEVISLEGRVLFSSSSDIISGFLPGTQDVSTAIEQEKTTTYLGKDTLTGQKVLSVTTPVYLTTGELAGAIRYVTGLGTVYRSITTLILSAFGAATVIFLFVLFSDLFLIRSILTPIRLLNETTKQIAAGDYGITIEKKFKDEIGELADSINFMSSEIDRSITIKNDFISSVSHELRTPLTAISGWAETLLQSVEGDNSIEERGLSVIKREAQRLRGLVEELLDFSRIESGRLIINRTPMDLPSELEDTIFMLEQRLGQDGLHVIYEDHLGEASVLADRARLRQVFVNIIDNARKHSKKGDAIEVSVVESDLEGFVEVKIRDHGPGISADILPHVKTKFFKGDANKPGSGIGLAVSDEIVNLHNGKLLIESIPDEGTTVSVVLPLEESKI